MQIRTFVTILCMGAFSAHASAEKMFSEGGFNKGGLLKVSAEYFQEDSTRRDTINLPFGTSKRHHSLGSVTVIDPAELLQYNSIQDVESALTGLVPGSVGGLNIRGLGSPLVVIDGVPRPISSVNIEEIEQITVLKDVNASVLYGVQANNGVILITTKRGTPNDKRVSLSFEKGLSDPIRLPKFLGAADYMELYNEALANDGITPLLYSQEEIDGARSGTNPTMYPDADYYSSEFLKGMKPTTRVVSQFSGGNENAQYYLTAGWRQEGTLLNMAEGANDKDQRFNVRSNVNFKITDGIKSNVNVVAIWDITRRANGDYWGDAAELRPNLYPPLIDTALLNDEQFVPTANLINGRYLAGGLPGYQNNIYANLHQSGYYTQTNTTVQFNNGIDFDLKRITPGLSAKTFIGFDFNNQYRETQGNTYAVYVPEWSVGPNNEDILSLDEKIGADLVPGVKSLGSTSLMRNLAFYGLLNYARAFGDKHAFNANAVAYGEYFTQTGVLQPDKKTHLGMRVNYAYNNRYIVDFSSALVSSAKLHTSNRVGFSPSLALGWIVSEENFLSSSTIFDFLKVKASYGELKTDMTIPGYYLYEGTYVSSSSFTWNDGNRSLNSNIANTEKNYGLTYQVRNEINAGVEAMLFNSLRLDANVFQERNTNLVAQPFNTYPDYLGGVFAYENFGEEKVTGFEIGASWSKPINHKLSIQVGANIVTLNTEVVKRDENWEYDYLYRAGRSISAIYGLEAIGLFRDDADIAGHETQSFGTISPGDIKYKDQNADGIIDENDEVQIGQTAPKFYGGFHLKVKYGGLSLFALATARSGSDRLFNNSYYWVYGDRKYSEVVTERWTPATAATATYPRLTSLSSSNNFRPSTFWLYDNSLIGLERLQLSYDLPNSVTSKVRMKNVGVYVRGSNLVRLSKNPERMDLNIGSEPQYRYYAVGLRATL